MGNTNLYKQAWEGAFFRLDYVSTMDPGSVCIWERLGQRSFSFYREG